MAKEPQTPATEAKPEKKVEPIDFTKPFYMTIYQSPTRNNVELFQGEDALAEAKASASKKSSTTKAQVAVVGPQVCVYAPPKPAEAEEIQMDWTV